MKIIIDYESSWRNSFLDGSNNEKLPKSGRKFIASSHSLKTSKNFLKREITIDTIMGVLNRLIGDQKKLYQAREGSDYFFKDLEPLIRFDDVESKRVVTQEMTFIRNIKSPDDKKLFVGAIKANDPMFSSDYSKEFWGVLALSFEEVCSFIVNEIKVEADIDLDPLTIIGRLRVLDKEKPVENKDSPADAMATLHKEFPGIAYLNKKEQIEPISIYCSALYLQLKRLSNFYDMETAKTKAGGISGISKRGFTEKDFMGRFSTGGKKKVWGNPYIRKERIKGVGEVISLMTKASGQLEIEISVDREQGKKIQSMIENAGVSSFYLGKKGLAYVSKIRV